MKRKPVIRKRNPVGMIVVLVLMLLTASAVHAEEDTRGLFGSLLEGMLSAANSSAKTSMSNVTVEKIPDQTYTGKAITPTVKVTFWGSRLRRGTDYTLTYSNNRAAGTAKVRINGKGQFTGSKTVTFKIVKKNGSTSVGNTSGKTSGKTTSSGKKFTVKLGKTVYTYNGKNCKPTVKVTAGGKSVSSRYYTVKYTDNRSVGDATVTVTGKGDYKDYKGTAKFRIDLKKTSLASVKAVGNSEIKVTWRKDPQADGYQIECGTRKTFGANVKKITIRSGSTTSEVIERLTASKKYYVRVRAYKKVGSRNRYAEWSTVRNATAKE